MPAGAEAIEYSQFYGPQPAQGWTVFRIPWDPYLLDDVIHSRNEAFFHQ